MLSPRARTLLFPSLFKPAPLRKRLWQGAIALAVFMMCVAAVNQVIAPEKSVTPAMLGHDFLPFYTAGSFARTGMPDLLYDLPTVKAVEHEIADNNGLEIGKSFGPFWNPPFYAWTFATLSALPYRQALLLWTLINVAAILTAVLLMRRFFPAGCDWRTTTLVPMLLLVSMPFIQAISHGQNTFTSLMLVVMIATAWRERRPISAGIVCGLLMYKPQLAVVLMIVMTLDLGWRVMLAMCSTGAILLMITGLTLPGAIDDYINKLPLNLHFMQIENAYLWERHVTFKAFWRLLLQGRAAGDTSVLVNMLTLTCSAAVACGLLVASWRLKRPMIGSDAWSDLSQGLRRDRLIAATIAATPLLMPFYFDYDLLLLAVPATLLAAELSGRASGAILSRRDRWLIGCWCMMFLWMMINPGMGSLTRVNGTVVLLSCVAGLLIRRAAGSRRTAVTKPTVDRQPQVVTVQRLAA